MPRWIIGIAGAALLAGILVVAALFMSSGPLQNQPRSPGEPGPQNVPAKP